MSDSMTRRTVLALLPAAAVSTLAYAAQEPASTSGPAVVPGAFPEQDPAIVKEMVSVSHGNVARVRELVGRRPALARAAWDWGYGDWETALAAASHVGNREIAGILLASGAHPTMFSAAMLGQVEVVKAFVAAAPGVQRTRGPHGITLLAHARAGGAGAVEVVRYLEELGDADRRYTSEALSEADRAALTGAYAFGTGATDRLVVEQNPRGDLSVRREGTGDRRGLFHQGLRAFIPAGAEAVRLRFEPASGPASVLIVEDGEVVVRARR